MSNKAVDVRAVCPYFLSDLTTGVRCEGVTEKDTTILAFADKMRKERHEDLFCCAIDNYRQCPLYRALAYIKNGGG